MSRFVIVLLLNLGVVSTGLSQEIPVFMRIINLKVDAGDLSKFKHGLLEDINTAIEKEPGVLEIYVVQDQIDSTKITVIETFASKDAHASHQTSSHYLRFMEIAEGMILDIQRTEVVPISLASKLQFGLVGKKNIQARPAASIPFGKDAFKATDLTVIRWLGNAGFLINSRGTTFMIDPLMQGFDMPIMIDIPISPQNVPSLDAVLITHSDNDHFSIPTLNVLNPKTKIFHSTVYVDSLMNNLGFASEGHQIGEEFQINDVEVKLTPADHDWQNYVEGASDRIFKKEDSAGFWIKTKDGTIWMPGDSRLLEEHLAMETPDAILFDFSDSEWHFTFEGAVKLANAYPETPLILHHWGTVDAPDFSPFNGDPEKLKKAIVNPNRIVVLAPGEPFVLKRIH